MCIITRRGLRENDVIHGVELYLEGQLTTIHHRRDCFGLYGGPSFLKICYQFRHYNPHLIIDTTHDIISSSGVKVIAIICDGNMEQTKGEIFDCVHTYYVNDPVE